MRVGRRALNARALLRDYSIGRAGCNGDCVRAIDAELRERTCSVFPHPKDNFLPPSPVHSPLGSSIATSGGSAPASARAPRLGVLIARFPIARAALLSTSVIMARSRRESAHVGTVHSNEPDDNRHAALFRNGLAVAFNASPASAQAASACCSRMEDIDFEAASSLAALRRSAFIVGIAHAVWILIGLVMKFFATVAGTVRIWGKDERGAARRPARSV